MNPERARFQQEAQAASALNHPNICTVHDLQESAGQYFIVMEYIDGKTLRQMIPVQKLQVAIGYAIQIGEALQEAHSKGVIHRDVKTDNIMVNSRNQVKVMDFGLAKLKGSLKLTRTTSTVGTLAYMAPEQIQGGEVDARSDIFSFGVVVYELLTGHLPFDAVHEAAMMYSILNEAPQPVQKYLPEVSSELIHILNRSLEKDPEDRYQAVNEMLIDLRRARKETSKVSRVTPSPVYSGQDSNSTLQKQPTEQVSHSKFSSLRIISLLVAVLLIAAVSIIYLIVFDSPPELNPDMIFRPLEIPSRQISYPSLSRDGNWIAFAARDENDEWSVYFMNANKGESKRLVTEEYNTLGGIDISPDGSEILYMGYLINKPGSMYAISSSGGLSRKIAESARYGKWKPEGERIGYISHEAFNLSGKREFRTVRPDGGDDRLEFMDSLSRGESYSFDWSPDGKSIAWLRAFPNYEEIIIRDLTTGKERQLTYYKKSIDEIAWASNGQIFFSSRKGGNMNIWMIPAKGGEAVQVTRGTGPDTGIRISADNQRILYIEEQTFNNIWRANIDGTQVRQLTFDDRFATVPTFSPDKKNIAFSLNSRDFKDPGYKIFIMQSDGTNLRQLPTGEGNFVNPRWSHDGKYMTTSIWAPYDSGRVYLIETSNPGSPKLIGKGIGSWWIDSDRFITINPYPNIFSTLYTVGQEEPLKVSNDFTLEFPLPDAKHILVAYYRKGWWLKNTATGRDTVSIELLPAEYYIFAWPSVSLKYLIYLKSNGEVWLMSLPDLHQRRLPEVFNGLNPFHMDLQLSLDDQEVVFLKSRGNSRLVIIDNVFK